MTFVIRLFPTSLVCRIKTEFLRYIHGSRFQASSWASRLAEPFALSEVLTGTWTSALEPSSFSQSSFSEEIWKRLDVLMAHSVLGSAQVYGSLFSLHKCDFGSISCLERYTVVASSCMSLGFGGQARNGVPLTETEDAAVRSMTLHYFFIC